MDEREIFDSERESSYILPGWDDPMAKVRRWMRERLFDEGDDLEIQMIGEKIDLRNQDLGRTGE